MLLSLLALAATTSAAGFPDCQNGPLSNNTVCDSSASVIDRAKAVVAALTIQEKFNLTGSSAPSVDRLGLPAYTWWNEGLVRLLGHYSRNATVADSKLAWSGLFSGCQLRSSRSKLFSCNFLPSANFDGSGFR